MERFTDEQVAALQAPLDSKLIKTREQAGRTLSYIEGFQAIQHANAVFGFGNWDSQIVALHPVEAPPQGQPNMKTDRGDGYLVAYICTMRVRVHFGDGSTFDQQEHEDVGYGEHIDYRNVGLAHESAAKEAQTDALKRALRHWGNQFGLSLYDKGQNGQSTPQRTSQGQPQASPAAHPGVGEQCPIHHKMFALTAKQREAGFAPSHPIFEKDENDKDVLIGWCQYDDVFNAATEASDAAN